MSADLLRQAAALMRERAEAATSGPGRQRGRYIVIGERDVIIGCDRAEDAEHIASWHPAVALAVAGWLDNAEQIYAGWITAVTSCRELEERGDEYGCAMKDCYECGQWHNCSHARPNVDHALAVARAYMQGASNV